MRLRLSKSMALFQTDKSACNHNTAIEIALGGAVQNIVGSQKRRKAGHCA
ncbi:MAG: hypothetical protein ACLVG9_00310 [Eubacteriales bacterium]